MQSRRDFLRSMMAASAVLPALPLRPTAGSARLTARPTPANTATGAGTWEITPGEPKDGVLLVPPSYRPGKPIPLVLALHGAGGGAQGQINMHGPTARERGFALLAVKSRGQTWDGINYRYSFDVTFIDNALKWAFDQIDVDPARVVCAGFSDGASYGLGLTLANGDLFTRALILSPGFIAASDSPPMGKPRFFESHGRQDKVLPIDGASRVIVPALQKRGYSVQYMEFDGGHQATPEILKAAADFVMA